MKLVKHPNLYKITWIDATSINVQERCQIPIQFVTYTDNMWCDIHHMNIGHIILKRSWLFDLDVIIYGRTNQYSFVHNDKKLKLISNQTKPPTSKKKVDKGEGKVMTLNPKKKVDKGKERW